MVYIRVNILIIKHQFTADGTNVLIGIIFNLSKNIFHLTRIGANNNRIGITQKDLEEALSDKTLAYGNRLENKIIEATPIMDQKNKIVILGDTLILDIKYKWKIIENPKIINYIILNALSKPNNPLLHIDFDPTTKYSVALTNAQYIEIGKIIHSDGYERLTILKCFLFEDYFLNDITLSDKRYNFNHISLQFKNALLLFEAPPHFIKLSKKDTKRYRFISKIIELNYSEITFDSPVYGYLKGESYNQFTGEIRMKDKNGNFTHIPIIEIKGVFE